MYVVTFLIDQISDLYNSSERQMSNYHKRFSDVKHIKPAYILLLLMGIAGFLRASDEFSQEIKVMPGNTLSEQKEQAEPESYLLSTMFADSSLQRPLSLEEVIQLALEHNRILKRYRLSEQSAKIRLKQAEYRFLPSAYITGGRNESRNDDLGYVIWKKGVSSVFGFSRALETGGAVSLSVTNSTSESSNLPGTINYNTNVGISISQPLLRGAGIRVNMIPIERAKRYARISLFYVKQSLINLITAIESQYWDLILVYEDQKIQKQALKRAKELLEVNKSLIESGRMAAQEIVQAESDIATREIALAAAENAIISTQVALQSQLDLGERILIIPTTEMEFKPVDIRLQDCLARAYKNRPDWAIANSYLEIERMNLIVAKNNNRYTLGSWASIRSDATSDQAFANSMRESFGFKSLAWNVGLSFTFPFNKQVLENGYQLNRLSYERQKIWVEELKDNIRIQVENAVRAVQFTLKQVGLAQRAKELASRKLQLEEDKMKVGRSTNFQVISYQRDLINAQNAELRAIASYLKALGQLESTMGTTLQKWGIEVEEMEE